MANGFQLPAVEAISCRYQVGHEHRHWIIGSADFIRMLLSTVGIWPKELSQILQNPSQGSPRMARLMVKS